MTRPRLVVFAGPNGSGKTTLTRQLRAQGVDIGEYINPDDIAVELTGSYEKRVRAAQQIADERREACLRNQRNFSFETVMSHESKIAFMRRARDAGFHVTLYFVGTDNPRINLSRVENRVSLGGHSVPEDRIISRYHRSMEALGEVILAVDRSVLFDNTYVDQRSTIRPNLEVRIEIRDVNLNLPFRNHSIARAIAAFAQEGSPKWILDYPLGHLYRARLKDELPEGIVVEVLNH